MKNLKNKRLWAAAFGPEILPYFHRKRSKVEFEIKHKDVDWLLKRVEFEELDFNKESMSSSVSELFEAIHVKAFNIIHELKSRGIICDIIIASPETSAIFEISSSSWWYPIWKTGIQEVWRNHRFKVYKDYSLEPNHMLITNDKLKDGKGLRVVNLRV